MTRSRFADAHALLEEINRLTAKARTPGDWRRITTLQVAYEDAIRKAVMSEPVSWAALV